MVCEKYHLAIFCNVFYLHVSGAINEFYHIPLVLSKFNPITAMRTFTNSKTFLYRCSIACHAWFTCFKIIVFFKFSSKILQDKSCLINFHYLTDIA